MTTTESRERQARIATAWAASPTATLAEVEAAVDLELEAEAEARAEVEARARELSASFVAMTSCAVPGCRHGKNVRTALCDRHTLVLRVVEAEAVAAETLADGRTVREWIAAFAAARPR